MCIKKKYTYKTNPVDAVDEKLVGQLIQFYNMVRYKYKKKKKKKNNTENDRVFM